jgi:shikimate dehydrogenase
VSSSVDRYAVVGNPIGHSKSPRIHALFAAQTGQRLRYDALLAPLDGFADTLEKFHEEGGRGLNVTLPFKEAAWRWVDQRSDRAQLAGAVNTIVLGPGSERFGDNTDGVGLVRDLRENLGVDLRGRRLLLLGAGGAAHGVIGPLLAEEPAALLVANRTVSRARELADVFAPCGPVGACGFADLQGHFDLLINATSAGLRGEVPPLPGGLVGAESSCYDMLYADEPTPFVRWAGEQGATLAADGLGMLVEQAAESFHLWRGVRPATQPVIAALRAST